MYDVIIVGAGTAGLSAAIYTVRSGKSALVLEATSYGGQIINTPDIENYPGIAHISGFDFATGLYNQAKDLGAEVKFERVISITDAASANADTSASAHEAIATPTKKQIDVDITANSSEVSAASNKKQAGVETEAAGNGKFKLVKTSGGEYTAKAVILATGAKNRPLGLPNEQALVGKGVSYCATCDGMFFRKKAVAVNGGGNTAVEDAAFLANYCSKVYIIHRRDTFRADAAEVERLRAKENVEFVLNSTVTKLNADTSGLTSIDVTNKTTGEVRNLPVAGLFVAIGQAPDNSAFSNVAKLDPKGYIEAGEDLKTGTEGIFTAGDCRTKAVRQLTTAASDGAVAALAACRYIDSLTV